MFVSNSSISPGNACKLCPDKSLVIDEMIPAGLICNLIRLQSEVTEQMATQWNDHSVEWRVEMEALLDITVN